MTLIFVALLVGLIVGSFLNVVIERYPIILVARWQKECREFLHLAKQPHKKKFNLLVPSSHCPQCKKPIKIQHNIPIFSYLFLGGRCADCKKQISWQYPAVELLTGLLTAFVVYRYHVTWQALALSVLVWSLVVLFFIDLKDKILPDEITLSVMWLGLLLSLLYLSISPFQAILGAILGYSVLWIVGTLYKLIRKKDGIGHGDYKMLAMLGAWLGASMLLNILLLAVILGLLTGTYLLMHRKISIKHPIPFGPFIATAAVITIFSGPFLIRLIIPGTWL